jgi:hypothetical protein
MAGLKVDLAIVVVSRHRDNKKMPNALALWVDPYWTGLWLNQPTKEHREGGASCAFRATGTLKPLTPSWVSSSSAKKTLCDTIKVHFFQVRPCKTDQEEASRDFLFCTSFPIVRGEQLPYGVFNYNDSQGQSCKFLKGVRVLVHDLQRVEVPREARMLRLQGPDAEHHKRTIEVGDWLDIAFNEMWPDLKTSMSNPRTYFRDHCCTLFFSDICKLFDKKGQSNLPPWLACYTLANALIVNGVCAPDFLAYFEKKDGILNIQEHNVQPVLRVVKCVLTPWTMCAREGLFWDDKCLEQPVEDQPFPLSFVPTSKGRVFGKDDCEGRASQAQEMVELLVNIHLYSQKYGQQATLRSMLQSGMCRQKLQMQNKLLLALLQGCCAIGLLLHTKDLQAQTVVGEANASAISSPSLHLPPQIVGHSFGMLTYGPQYMMMENTAWQRRVLGTDQRFTSKQGAFLHAWAKRTPGAANYRTKMIMAGLVTKTLEAKIYQKIYMGHDRLFFSDDGRRLQYGASLNDIAAGQSVCMTMERVLKELSAEHQSHPPFWKPREGASEMLSKYLQIQASVPSIRRVLMTPQKQEAEFETLMQDWEPLYEQDLHKPVGGGIWFTVDKDAWSHGLESELSDVVASCDLQMKTHAFIHSIVVSVVDSKVL